MGCGSTPKGDVNVDFFKAGFNLQVGNQKKGTHIDPKRIRNFIVADALHLPFQACIFKRVFCSHVIEHVDNPYLLLRELLRVAKDEVVVKCPHRLSRGAKMPFHKNYFNNKWFATALSGYDIRVSCSFRGFPFAFFGLFMLPHEIRIMIKK